jgi:hypothetical protein
MRKIIIVAGLLAGAAIVTGTPAKAAVGCQCVKLGAPSICVAGVNECLKYGGLCLAPCDYKPRIMMRHKKKKM